MSRNTTVLLLVLGAVCTAGGQVLTSYGQAGAGGAVAGLGYALAAIARMQIGAEPPKP